MLPPFIRHTLVGSALCWVPGTQAPKMQILHPAETHRCMEANTYNLLISSTVTGTVRTHRLEITAGSQGRGTYSLDPSRVRRELLEVDNTGKHFLRHTAKLLTCTRAQYPQGWSAAPCDWSPRTFAYFCYRTNNSSFYLFLNI